MLGIVAKEAARKSREIGSKLGTPVAQVTVQRLIGYWMQYHLAGGTARLVELGWMSKSTAYRSRREFRMVFGTDVEGWWPEMESQLLEASRQGER